jgi:hypothetical protein
MGLALCAEQTRRSKTPMDPRPQSSMEEWQAKTGVGLMKKKWGGTWKPHNKHVRGLGMRAELKHLPKLHEPYHDSTSRGLGWPVRKLLIPPKLTHSNVKVEIS